MRSDILKDGLLEKLALASGVSGDEQEIREILYQAVKPHAEEITFDGLGSFIARKGTRGPKVALIAHMDEVGFIVKHINAEGFIYFDTVGSWWNQSMLNQRVEIKTASGEKIPGIIGSVSPHALTEEDKCHPVKIEKMFIDIGAASAEQVRERGVAVGDFICPEPFFSTFGDDGIMAKALDNRAGCAVVAEIFRQCQNPDIQLYAVATVQEEVGLRGAQTSAEAVKPDIAIVIDTLVAGDTPGLCPVAFPLKLGAGPAISLFDKRYIAHRKLTQLVKNTAAEMGIDLQFCTLKTGATDGGRYNVMGGGRPVIALCLPTRYLHANASVICAADYNMLIRLVVSLVNHYGQDVHQQVTQFIG
ncbi:peptidase [Rahnella perminowiae]|uniref:peptidase n=1 Tax=Rahnella perminowiae TaxID=2816244 RepID=UPI001C25AC8C|nr:peptidase [Rahnella perminowiae]MBU9827591.1 peptidase [Rahnella perminowiae]